ncbi:MAG: hypothetical protein ACKN81_03545 [Pirellulaceae bacterium]
MWKNLPNAHGPQSPPNRYEGTRPLGSQLAPRPPTSTLSQTGSGGRWQVDRRNRIRF